VVVFFAARGFEAFEEEFFLTVFVGDFAGGIKMISPQKDLPWAGGAAIDFSAFATSPAISS
jgi:hypothetical protein